MGAAPRRLCVGEVLTTFASVLTDGQRHAPASTSGAEAVEQAVPVAKLHDQCRLWLQADAQKHEAVGVADPLDDADLTRHTAQLLRVGPRLEHFDRHVVCTPQHALVHRRKRACTPACDQR
jgi:hypothetical protein